MERPMLGTGCPLFDLLANDLGSLWRLTSLRWCLTVLTELLDVIGSTLRLFDNGSQRPSDVLSSSLRSREQSPRPSGRCASFSNSDCDSLFSRWNWIWELLSSDRVFPSRPKSAEFPIANSFSLHFVRLLLLLTVTMIHSIKLLYLQFSIYSLLY